MDAPLYNQIKTQICNKTGFDFENFISFLFLLIHGKDDFIPVRDVSDDGSDGIIKSKQQSLACYAPNGLKKSKALEKIEGDFESYQENWEADYPNWLFIVNHELAPYEIQKVNDLKQDATIYGIENLMKLIDSLSYSKIRKIALELNINEEFISQDYLRAVMNDLLEHVDKDNSSLIYESPTDIEKKIRINFSPDEIDDIKEEIELLYEIFPTIENLLGTYDDSDVSKIKHKILTDYKDTQGQISERIDKLTQQYIRIYSNENDSDYYFNLRGLVLYLFEQCLIGQRV